MEKIIELAKIFAKYKIYPKEKFTINTAVGWFLENSDNYYAQHLRNDFLPEQNYPSEKRGADLPFWGKEYFFRKGKRIFIVAQDSKTSDAGSIVFWAHLFGNLDLYKRFRSAFGEDPETAFKKYSKFILEECKLNLDFLYITDAKKVYQDNSREKFDDCQSQNLLKEEVNFCQPNVIIFLGLSGLELLTGKKWKLIDYYQSNEDIKIKGIDCFVFPFPTGKGSIWRNQEKVSGTFYYDMVIIWGERYA